MGYGLREKVINDALKRRMSATSCSMLRQGRGLEEWVKTLLGGADTVFLRSVGRTLRVIGAALIALCLVGCGKIEKSPKQQAPLKVRTMTVEPQSGSAVSRYVGTIEAAQETPLSLQNAGRVVSVAVKNGQRVQKGQTILQIDNTQELNAVRGAEASLQHAQDGYDRVSQVHAKGVVSDQKMVEIESQLAQARSLYEAAQQRLKECTLTAPCDGVVSGLDVAIGQTILPGTRVCSLLDMTGFCVRFTVPEKEIKGLTVSGERLRGEVEVAAVDAVYPIVVKEKGVTANPVTHTYEVVARINGGANVLMSGMVGKVTLNVEGLRFKDESIIIPAKCILLKPEGHTVWVIENGNAVRKDIIVDGYEADGVRVKSGLQAGDTLISDGYQKLYEGCEVIFD